MQPLLLLDSVNKIYIPLPGGNCSSALIAVKYMNKMGEMEFSVTDFHADYARSLVQMPVGKAAIRMHILELFLKD